MKKVIAIILSMLVLTACNNKNEPVETPAGGMTTPEITTTAPPLVTPPLTTTAPPVTTLPETIKAPLEFPAVLEIGDIVYFGGYDWRVLDVQDGRALIITENIIEKRPFCDDGNVAGKFVGWEDSDLREYLNGVFYSNFNESDRDRVIKVTNNNPDNPWLVSPSEKNTENYIFLLSLDELVQYFGDSGQLNDNRLNEPIMVDDGEWGVSWWWIDDERREYPFGVDDDFNSARIVYDNNGVAQNWWLRSPSSGGGGAAAVRSNGIIDVFGWGVGTRNPNGVRPALWLNIE